MMTSDEISPPVPLGENISQERKRKQLLAAEANSHLWSNVPIPLRSLPLTTQTSERGKKGAGNLALSILLHDGAHLLSPRRIDAH